MTANTNIQRMLNEIDRASSTGDQFDRIHALETAVCSLLRTQKRRNWDTDTVPAPAPETDLEFVGRHGWSFMRIEGQSVYVFKNGQTTPFETRKISAPSYALALAYLAQQIGERPWPKIIAEHMATGPVHLFDEIDSATPAEARGYVPRHAMDLSPEEAARVLPAEPEMSAFDKEMCAAAAWSAEPGIVDQTHDTQVDLGPAKWDRTNFTPAGVTPRNTDDLLKQVLEKLHAIRKWSEDHTPEEFRGDFMDDGIDSLITLIERHDAGVTPRNTEERINELLKSNNELLLRARKAEGFVKRVHEEMHELTQRIEKAETELRVRHEGQALSFDSFMCTPDEAVKAAYIFSLAYAAIEESGDDREIADLLARYAMADIQFADIVPELEKRG